MRDLELNTASVRELEREIGARGLATLCKLGHWLSLRQEEIPNWELGFESIRVELGREFGKCFVLPARFAPSLVTRSEVELFACSLPRFAIRTGLKEGGFVNIRRLATLAGQIAGADRASSREALTDLVLRAPCIADAYLGSPPWAKKGWWMITALLGKANGEIEAGEQDVSLSPYVRHMRPGGGMCAQATCFMANALHAKLEAPIHGMPEVTLIATSRSFAPRALVEFDGLSTEELERYFNSKRCDTVGAYWQAAKVQYGEADVEILCKPESNTVLELEHALRSYVMSEMPVIVPVDVGRMQGIGSAQAIACVQTKLNGETSTLALKDPLNEPRSSSVFDRNGLKKYLDTFDTTGSRAHVVMVVGCTKKEVTADPWSMPSLAQPLLREAPALFAFHDPAHQPYMQASAHELLLAGCYGSNTCLRNEDAVLSLGWFLPVTPRGVRMPLLDQTNGPLAGIRNIYEALREKDISLGGICLKTLALAKHKPEFRLIPLKRDELRAQLMAIQGENGRDVGCENLDALCARLIPRDGDSWCWLVVAANIVLLWDAARSVTKEELATLENEYVSAQAGRSDKRLFEAHAKKLAKKLLISAAAHQRGQQRVRNFSVRPSLKPAIKRLVALKGALRPALLTSFDTASSPNCSRLGTGAEPVEFYMLMQRTADRILLPVRHKWKQTWAELQWCLRYRRSGQVRLRGRLSALELMARASDDVGLIRKTAAGLLKMRREIIGLASYIPSLCAGPRTENGKEESTALRATRFVLRVAKAVRELSGRSKPMIVELVGGSLVLPVEQDSKTGKFFARCIDPSVGLKNLTTCLGYLIDEIESADVFIAFEYEPSALCALGALERVTEFCSMLDVRSVKDTRWDRVGVNLDIAHWAFLGRYRPADLPGTVRDRVVHAHVSSHSRGHLADAPLEASGETQLLRAPGEFMDWFLLLEDLRDLGHFQGNVSLELECCKSRASVHASLCTLSEWLGS